MRQQVNRTGEMAAFVRVVEAGGFAPAARALGLSPSALSKLVTRLERRLGVLLLRRSTRRLALTPEGATFHQRAVAILADIEAAERDAGSAGRPAGRVRLNSSASYVAHVLAPILPDFLARYPDIAIDIVQTDTVADLVTDGSDVAVRAGPLPDSGLIARSLGQTPIVVAAAPAWIERNRDRGPAARLDFLHRRAAAAWAGDAAARVRVSDGEGIRQLALAGVAPARLAEFTIRADLAAGRLVRLPDGGPADHEPFHILFTGRATQLPARVRVLLEFLADRGRVD